MEAGYFVTASRLINAPLQRVYEVWTTPEQMSKWMGRVDADVRVGGAYRIEHEAAGARYIHQGEYLAVEPLRRIKQTFRAGPEGADARAPSAYKNETIEITFTERNGQTEVRLHDAWDGEKVDAEGLEAARQAWDHWLALSANWVEGR